MIPVWLFKKFVKYDSTCCNKFVYYFGTTVFTSKISSVTNDDIEEFVQKLSGKSGQIIDWCLFDAKPHILALGNIKKVTSAIHDLYPITGLDVNCN